MKHSIRGLAAVFAVLFVFLFASACAPNKALTRDKIMGKKAIEVESEDEEFNYNESEDNESGAIKVKKSGRYGEPKKGAPKNEAKIEEGDEDFGAAADNPKRDKFFQTGTASWYGREFQGKRTASGEKFDMNDFTAAHRTLPFGTVLIVKNLDNGKTVRVKVNDRGPFKDDRILDLSYAAGKKINMLSTGEATVGIQVLKKGDNKKIATKKYADEDVEGVSGEDGDNLGKKVNRSSQDGGESDYILQAGAFYSQRNAKSLKRKIEGLVDGSVTVIREGDLYKVRIEGVRSEKEAKKYRKMLRDEDISAYILKNRE